MNRKSLSVEWKDVDQGTFRARFSTFNVVDKDGDVTFPGALPVGKEVPIGAYGHQSHFGALPTGKGVIGADDIGAYVDGRFFLDTAHGMDTYRTVKQLWGLQEWSYGYQVLKESDHAALAKYPGARRGLVKLDVNEVSPVLVGAGVGTGTDSIKAVSGATDLPLYDRNYGWDASAAEGSVRRWASSNGSGDPDTMDWAKYGKAFFWYDAGNREQFGSYKLGFAEVTGGTLKAVPRGIFAVAAVLQGSRGGVSIPSDDAAGVKARVAGYYARMRTQFDDDSITPPWDDGGKALSPGTVAERCLAQVDGWRGWMAARAEYRAGEKAGRRLSAQTRAYIEDIVAGLRRLLDEADLMPEGDGGKSAPLPDIQAIADAYAARERDLSRQLEKELQSQ